MRIKITNTKTNDVIVVLPTSIAIMLIGVGVLIGLLF